MSQKMGMLSKEIVITAYKRTAVGGFMGSLSSLRAVELGGKALAAAIDQSKIKPELKTTSTWG